MNTTQIYSTKRLKTALQAVFFNLYQVSPQIQGRRINGFKVVCCLLFCFLSAARAQALDLFKRATFQTIY